MTGHRRSVHHFDGDHTVAQVQVVRAALAEAGRTDWEVTLMPSRTHPGRVYASIDPPRAVKLAPSDDDLRTAWRAWFVAGIAPGCITCWLADTADRCSHEIEWA